MNVIPIGLGQFIQLQYFLVSPVDSVGATSVVGGRDGLVGSSSVINSMKGGDLLRVDDFREKRPYFTNSMTIEMTPQTLDERLCSETTDDVLGVGF